ncbi:organic cation transporter protein-like [Macrobrachium rosenbergii]|uniref:organic cation transporter protein-like n=1 Tax=Macrobrachium rosenbergii TaxID=79674 RepID=UPI0034D3D1A8
MEDNFDSILTQLGTGKWNLFYYITLSYWYACVSYHALGGAFLAPAVDYTCRVPDSAVVTKVSFPSDFDATEDFALNNASFAAKDGNESEESACTYLIQNVTTGNVTEEQCTSWDFDKSTFESTVTSEFDLVCDWKFLRATYQSVYMFGILVGAGVNGYMADKYGRKRMVTIGAILYSLIAVISAWLPNISTIIAARFMLGTMHPTSLQTGYILGMEVTKPSMRSAIGMLQFLSWAVGTMCWGGWAYLIRDWRWLQTAVSLPCFLFLPTLWIMDESPRWLIVIGRHKEALKVLQKAARWNKVELPEERKLLDMMTEINEQLRCKNVREDKTTMKMKLKRCLKEATILFRTPKLRTITLAMYVDYFVAAMVYFGLNLSGGSFTFDPFVFMVISGIVEIPSNTVTIPIVSYFGRKIPLIVSYFITGVSMLIQAVISEEQMWLVITLVMIGKLAISIVFQILFLYASELIPTEVRTRGMGTAMMSSRAGAMVSPFLMGFIGAVYPWTTPVVFGLASIVAGLAAIPLSETKDSPLPDTIAHLEGYDDPAT